MDSITSNVDRPATHKSLRVPEILGEIFQHLNAESKGRAAQVASLWHDVIERPKLWNNVTIRLKYDEDDSSRFRISPTDRHWDSVIPAQPHRQFPFTKLTVNYECEPTWKTINLIVQRFPNLTSLELAYQSSNKMTDLALTLIVGGLKSLRHLRLSGCFGITDQGLATLCASRDGNVPALHSLTLFDMRKLTDRSLRYIGVGQPALRSLDISECNRVTDRGLEYLIQLVRLRELNLSCCPGITNEGMVHVSKMLQLAKLDVSDSSISSAGLKLLSFGGKSRLTRLELRNCPMVDDTCGRSLARLTYLTNLNLFSTSIGDTVLRCLADGVGASRIDTLRLTCCRNLTDEAGVHLARMRNLREVHLNNSPIGDEGVRRLVDVVDSRIEVLSIDTGRHVTEDVLAKVNRLPRLRQLDSRQF